MRTLRSLLLKDAPTSAWALDNDSNIVVDPVFIEFRNEMRGEKANEEEETTSNVLRSSTTEHANATSPVPSSKTKATMRSAQPGNSKNYWELVQHNLLTATPQRTPKGKPKPISLPPKILALQDENVKLSTSSGTQSRKRKASDINKAEELRNKKNKLEQTQGEDWTKKVCVVLVSVSPPKSKRMP